MKTSLHFLGWLLLPAALAAGEPVNWPLETPPARANTAGFAVARNDWMTKFQANLDRARRGGIDLLFLGDSLSENWSYASGGGPVFARFYGKERAASFGISGDRTENILWRVQNGELAGLEPGLIVLLAGTNNLGRNTPAEVAEGVRSIVNACRERCPGAHVLVLGIFPRGETPGHPLRTKLAEVNRLLAPLGGEPGITFLDIGGVFLREDGTLRRDLMPDALHPNRAGYEAWANAIRPVVAAHVTLPAN